ncbi:PEP-CTERM sorting domain-containing protein [Puniceicoccus vermicola]|uniref:PEP-CTERM sorting domain-containing protein n=1 Tax=Puniceicoccus vermicola TaxID=388746 RepID=A0A7X1E4B4_9BACT|nr:PEP-CTERM sorting domain-containing protein [Puniceicoccus vermicola]MBC2601864.1 PEP-CTERM sorting domain-containing protein [Puniceicoccus vermicola]
MNKSRLLGALAVVSTFGAGFCEAQVIIDGTAPDYVNNGSFETTADWWGGGATTLSSDLGFDNRYLQRNNNLPNKDGNNYAVIGLDGSTNRGAYQDTGYDLVEGDTFDLSFWQANHFGIESGDEFSWQLFTTTTNDDNGTVATIVASGQVLANTTSSFLEESYTGIGSVGSDIAGDRLFIAFSRSDNMEASDFLGLDQVNLSVSSAIPEPASAVLISGFLALGFVGMRRRRS